MAERKKLAIELDLACDIYSLQAAGRPTWWRQLIERHDGKYTKAEVTMALATLGDWGIVTSDYGETGNGTITRLLAIDDDHIDRVAILFRTHYTPPPGADPDEPSWPRTPESQK